MWAGSTGETRCFPGTIRLYRSPVPTKAETPFVSIVVPVLNEAALIGPFLRHLETLHPAVEVIVVDGGSTDQTLTMAGPLADRVFSAPRGRAAQMNAGAEIATGAVLWFLHADLRVPAEAIEQLQAALEDG